MSHDPLTVFILCFVILTMYATLIFMFVFLVREFVESFIKVKFVRKVFFIKDYN